jgi:hypothetical protein
MHSEDLTTGTRLVAGTSTGIVYSCWSNPVSFRFRVPSTGMSYVRGHYTRTGNQI